MESDGGVLKRQHGRWVEKSWRPAFNRDVVLLSFQASHTRCRTFRMAHYYQHSMAPAPVPVPVPMPVPVPIPVHGPGPGPGPGLYKEERAPVGDLVSNSTQPACPLPSRLVSSTRTVSRVQHRHQLGSALQATSCRWRTAPVAPKPQASCNSNNKQTHDTWYAAFAETLPLQPSLPSPRPDDAFPPPRLQSTILEPFPPLPCNRSSMLHIISTVVHMTSISLHSIFTTTLFMSISF